MNNNEKKNYEEEYKRTAGIQAPMEDGNTPSDDFGPVVILIIIVITIGFIFMLAWGFIVVFGT